MSHFQQNLMKFQISWTSIDSQQEMKVTIKIPNTCDNTKKLLQPSRQIFLFFLDLQLGL